MIKKKTLEKIIDIFAIIAIASLSIAFINHMPIAIVNYVLNLKIDSPIIFSLYVSLILILTASFSIFVLFIAGLKLAILEAYENGLGHGTKIGESNIYSKMLKYKEKGNE